MPVDTNTHESISHADPTALTTDQLHAEITHLRELIEARLAGIETATKLRQEAQDRLPIQMDEKILALGKLHEEKFNSIQTQFRERDVRTEQSSKDSKVAVDAALQAAKEAVGEQNKSSALAIAKSEASTTKQIDQIGLAMAAQSKNVDDKFSDMKDRLSLIDGRGSKVEGRETGIKDSWGWLVGAVGILVALYEAVHK